jgi:hypothetical protein
MYERKNSYSKANDEQPERPVLKPRKIKVKQKAINLNKEIPDNYTKKDGQLSAALFVIVSGGVKREKDYFKKLSHIKTFPRIELHFIAKDKESGEEGLSPDKMYKVAKSIKDKFIEENTQDFEDAIYLVADVDHFMNDLIKLKPLCKEDGLHLIISNPCLEIWLYYGKCAEIPNDFIVSENKLKISSEFKEYLNKVFEKSGGIDPRKAIFDIHTAIKNAKKNYSDDENGIPKLFSTNMFILAENLLPLIQTELLKLIGSETKRIEEYKKKK